ncbi:MAG TPA: 23S rRNA (uracil(1939)-C(5))-methyltransferase RlmD [Candidatus Binatia bacterium]|nr:23S rRNA (uracil(1939)-C(5))-methyltransferase RlmD [Candidatus Binatia bacterium]
MDFKDLLANGQAVGRYGGLVVFVTGPLPGERALVRISAVKAKYAVGELIEVLTVSPHRVESFCKIFGVCGGCQVQHLAYPAQLAWKRDLVRAALARIGGIDVAVNPPIGMREPRAYRNKISLVIEHRDGRAELGFYRARSHRLVPVDGCPVALPQLDASIGGLAASIDDTSTSGAFSEVRHAVMRAGAATGESVLALTTRHRSERVQASGDAIARRLPGVVGVGNSYELTNDNAVLGRRLTTIWGRAEMEERIGPVRFRVSPASFFQVNGEMVGRIFDYMAPVLGSLRVVDLYCGAGTFSMFFAHGGARVVGIEENPNAVREALANAELNGVGDRATFLAGRVEQLLRGGAGREALMTADIVFLDPPRKGSDESTLAAIAALRPPNVWYLSCNPATLARDIAQLIRGGYLVGIVQPFDMFPQTGHVETLVTMYLDPATAIAPPPAAGGEAVPPWTPNGDLDPLLAATP